MPAVERERTGEFPNEVLLSPDDLEMGFISIRGDDGALKTAGIPAKAHTFTIDELDGAVRIEFLDEYEAFVDDATLNL